ncbi:MAG: nitrite reductase (NO-forming)/hydroxylamine reductase [Limisphaerales bacterium]|jgi:nitrite reductase (NO-forming)/hydroxylamine reductase
MSTINIFSLGWLWLVLLTGLSQASWGNSLSADAQALFSKHCAACHDNQNAQVEPTLASMAYYPSLVDVARRRTAGEMVRSILNGKFDRAGEQAGQTIPTMPAHDYLSNEGIANLVNYVREDAQVSGRVTTESVALLRGDNEEPHIRILSDNEYARADNLYQTNCAGCHAVNRRGRSGASLYDWAIAARGSEATKLAIHFGTPWGMPNWGMQGKLDAEDISLLAQYLAIPSRGLPVFNYEDVITSWHSVDDSASGKAEPQSIANTNDLFVSLLHDTGKIMFLDGAQKEILTVVDAVIAPSEAIRSADGRYLYVMSRSADVVLFDLGVIPIREIARVKTGYEGRSLAISEDGLTIAVGIYWPPQVVFLDAQNLAPKSVYLTDDKAYENNQTDAEISQVFALPGGTKFLASSKAAGDFLVIDADRGILSRQHGYPFLRAGSTDASERYLLTPADDGKVIVFDLVEEQVVRVLEAQGLTGGSRGFSFRDDSDAGIWVTSGLGSGGIYQVNTHGKPKDWSFSLRGDPSWSGSLNITSHPESDSVWIDFPLNDSRRQSESIGVLSKDDELSSVRLLNAVELAGLSGGGMARAVHPQFNVAGDEVWLTIWNRQDRASAILVLDAATLEVVKVFKDSRLITPIRTFNLPYRR